MTTDELVTALGSGAKLRRPSWPEGHYIEVEGNGTQRKVCQMTMYYYGEGVPHLWALRRFYADDFTANDFVEM